MWTQKGKCRIVTKDEEYGIMISDFQSQDFGFGYPLTAPDLQTFIEYRTLHPRYVDTESATDILGHTNKEPITMGRNHFCHEFEYGRTAEVYCTYNPMVLQLE